MREQVNLDAVKARIRALRSKTVANGCTQDEALAAASKAIELLARYGLADGEEAVADRPVKISKGRRSRLELLFQAIAWVCHCRLYYRHDVGASQAVYIGRDPWPDVAAYLHAVVVGATRRATKEFRGTHAYKAKRLPRTRAAALRVFLEGFVLGLSGKLIQLKRQAGEDAQQAADLAIADAARNAVSGLKTLAPRKPLKLRRAGDTLMSGFDAGRRANVSWGVDAAPGGPRLLPAPARG